MKQILIGFSIICFAFSCKKTDKTIVTSKIINEPLDSTPTVKEPKLNITKDFVLGKFNYKQDTTFIKVSNTHSAKTLYLNKEVYNAFLKMHNAAKVDSISLKILSGTRNFSEQKAIWERKWQKYANLKPLERAQKILEYSSMPSSSRHHWGTDLDLNSLSNSYFSTAKGLKEYQWLKTNANTFGFYQVYTEKNEYRTGYNLEKWHWSYLPLASKYLDFYNKRIISDDIKGFKGSNLAQKLNIINAYVNGVSKKVKTYKQKSGMTE